MRFHPLSKINPIGKPFSRRQVLAGSAALLGAAAIAPRTRALGASSSVPINLTAGSRTLEVNGRAASVYALTTPDKSFGLHFTKGQPFAVTLDNALSEPTLIHWHGLTPPSDQDGTPDLSQAPLGPGKRYAYNFILTRSGTFWMHSHAGFQEQKLLAAPLIVSDPEDAQRDEQEIVVMLHDFAFREPTEIMTGLMGKDEKGSKTDMSGMDMSKKPIKAMDHPATAEPDADKGVKMDMPMDLNDVDFDAYLANERTLADPDVRRVEPGGKLRLRIINGASATNFWIDLGALQGELIAVDGDPVAPIQGKRFELAMAQRIDIRITLPKGEGAYPVLGLREGAVERTGIVLATKNAPVGKIAAVSKAAHPRLVHGLEQRLSAANPMPTRAADRVLNVDLTGDMQIYNWGLNGRAYGHDQPLMVRQGQRVEIVMRNRTMMSHPMHLHGHHFQVVALGEKKFSGALRDTVLVPPMTSVTVAFDADNPGKWAFHCHNLYHMMAGMMSSVQYES